MHRIAISITFFLSIWKDRKRVVKIWNEADDDLAKSNETFFFLVADA